MSKSPNHYNGRNGWRPDIIVCHITEGAFSGAVSWLCNPKSFCSSHFVVGAKGEVEQLVDLKDAAWCNGNDPFNPSSRLYYKKAKNALVKSRQANANFYTYSIEHEGFSYVDRFGALTEEQYQASLRCMKTIIHHMKDAYGITFSPDREHLIGHCDIDPVGKPHCPAPDYGKNFPFERFIGDLRAWMELDTTSEKSSNPYTVKVTADSLNIRSGAGTNHPVVGAITDKGIYTIVEEAKGAGADLWGRLKSGAGWISLDFTKKASINPVEQTFTSYRVKVSPPHFIHSEAGINTPQVGIIKSPCILTIVEEGQGMGAKRWGRLKSGAGWISLDATQRV